MQTIWSAAVRESASPRGARRKVVGCAGFACCCVTRLKTAAGAEDSSAIAGWLPSPGARSRSTAETTEQKRSLQLPSFSLLPSSQRSPQKSRKKKKKLTEAAVGVAEPLERFISHAAPQNRLLYALSKGSHRVAKVTHPLHSLSSSKAQSCCRVQEQTDFFTKRNRSRVVN